MHVLYTNCILEKFSGEGLTFDDISLVTQYADFLPDETDIQSKISRNISLNIPFVSAAMDTVTEARMARLFCWYRNFSRPAVGLRRK